MATHGIMGLITQWLQLCEHEHVGICSHENVLNESSCAFTIKLIDTRNRCIVNAEKYARYVALSYVWGKSQQLKLLQGNKEQWMNVGGLQYSYNKLSATIRDCIKLCEGLGERYLWVDTLCIIQDDLLDKKWQIGRMGKIYGGATLTVVAAHGDDANAGLPRLHQRTRAGKLEVDNTLLEGHGNPLVDLNRILSLSTWDTRGWTFQEKELSNRLLVFSEDRVYFRCQHVTLSEDKDDWYPVGQKAREPNTSPNEIALNTALSSQPIDLERYTRLVSEYSSRNLTNQGDALDAFAGVLETFTRIQRTNITFAYGLPVAAFDYAFCWSVKEHQPHLRRPQFPSWSWVGWAQKSSYEQAGEYRYTSNIIKVTSQAANGTWASFQSKALGPRCWGDFSNSARLIFETSVAVLRVSRNSLPSGGRNTSSGTYSVSCPYDESISYGCINLDYKWRQQKADEMKFIVIRVACLGDQNVITHTLCIEEAGGKWYRVNIMGSKIIVKAWEASKPSSETVLLF